MFRRPPYGILALGLGHIIVGSTVLLWVLGAFSTPAGSGGGFYQSGEAEFEGFIGGIITLFLLIITPIIILMGIGLLLQSETAYVMAEFGAAAWIAVGVVLFIPTIFSPRAWFLVFPEIIYGSLVLFYFSRFVMTQSTREYLLNKALTELNRGDIESAKKRLNKIRPDWKPADQARALP